MPSLAMISLAIITMDGFLTLWSCIRARMTSCGYVNTVAMYLDETEAIITSIAVSLVLLCRSRACCLKCSSEIEIHIKNNVELVQ